MTEDEARIVKVLVEQDRRPWPDLLEERRLEIELPHATREQAEEAARNLAKELEANGVDVVETTTLEKATRLDWVDIGEAIKQGLMVLSFMISLPKALDLLRPRVKSIAKAIRRVTGNRMPLEYVQYLALDAAIAWMDEHYGEGEWELGQVVYKPVVGLVLVAIENAATGERHLLEVPLESYVAAEAGEELVAAWRRRELDS